MVRVWVNPLKCWIVGGRHARQWPARKVVAARLLQLLSVGKVVLHEGRRHWWLVIDGNRLSGTVYCVLVAQPSIAVHRNKHRHSTLVNVSHHVFMVRVRLAGVVLVSTNYWARWWRKAFGVGQ